MLATPLAVVCGLTYNFLPFMILPLYTSLERIDGRLHEAAGDLYAKPVTTFRKVTFPLSMPGVVSGTLLTFIPAAATTSTPNCSAPRTPAWSETSSRRSSCGSSTIRRPRRCPSSSWPSILLMVTLYIRRSGTEDLV